MATIQDILMERINALETLFNEASKTIDQQNQTMTTARNMLCNAMNVTGAGKTFGEAVALAEQKLREK